MRNDRKVETRRDRKALARDAGMGRISPLSVLAGALSGIAAVEALVVIAAGVVVAVNGGTNFSSWRAGQFKVATGAVVAVALFVGFVFGGYVSGRMSRRTGATHGLMAGVVGAALVAVATAAVEASGADTGLARVARHIQVADTWDQWRTLALLGAAVAAGAIVLGGLLGGIKGEQWHGKLLARAVDPSFGPEAEERAEARKRLTEAEVARLKAADHVGRLTATSRAVRRDDRESEVRGNTVTGPVPTTVLASPASTTNGAVSSPSTRRNHSDDATKGETAARDRRPRHLLGRR